jgi:hypothetical protein
MTSTRDYAHINVKQLTAPALTYFALVFGAGFLLGTLRVLWLVPRFGARVAELAETPVMLVVIFCAARWIVKRFAVPSSAAVRLGVGLLALVCLLTVEFTVVLWLQGLTIRESIANRDPVAGAVYVASLLLFALMPLFVSRSR